MKVPALPTQSFSSGLAWEKGREAVLGQDAKHGNCVPRPRRILCAQGIFLSKDYSRHVHLSGCTLQKFPWTQVLAFVSHGTPSNSYRTLELHGTTVGGGDSALS